jgi:hypothetical protein
MLKRILIVLVLCMAAVLVFQRLRGGTRVAYVNGIEPYRAIPGKEYILQRACYVYVYPKNESPHAAVYPLLGVNAPALVASNPLLPERVSADEIAKTRTEIRLLDVIPIGTAFKVLSVRREAAADNDAPAISYEVAFLDDWNSRPYQRVDIRGILLPPRDAQTPPLIDPAIAVERFKY